MKKPQFAVGTAVRSEVLGRGVIVACIGPEDLGLVHVRFDVTPPYEYNCGMNPAAVLTSMLAVEEQE
jgi:hypothetical protein